MAATVHQSEQPQHPSAPESIGLAISSAPSESTLDQVVPSAVPSSISNTPASCSSAHSAASLDSDTTRSPRHISTAQERSIALDIATPADDISPRSSFAPDAAALPPHSTSPLSAPGGPGASATSLRIKTRLTSWQRSSNTALNRIFSRQNSDFSVLSAERESLVPSTDSNTTPPPESQPATSPSLPPTPSPATVVDTMVAKTPVKTSSGNGGNSHFNQKIKNFFRINSGTHGEKDRSLEGSTGNSNQTSPKADPRSTLRQSKNRFFSSTVGRLRSATTASEGNPLDEAMSPTAHANPYFAHQGHPGLRHHNEGSVPPSPPDTPSLKIQGPDGVTQQPTNANKEELARKLRRVASAPNAQGLFTKSNGEADGERPATAELGKEPLMQSGNLSTLGFVDSKPAESGTLAVPDHDELGSLPTGPRNNLAFRRTYSSNSIKVRDVEVGPSSFDKIKLIGKGDVGKVYLVKEKKSSRLYAMKGLFLGCFRTTLKPLLTISTRSLEQKGDDQAQQDQESVG